MMRYTASILLCYLLCITQTFAQDKRTFPNTVLPDYVQLQFAGNIGILSAGIGYDLAHDKIHISILDGFVPQSIAGSNINTIALKNAFDLFTIRTPHHTRLKPYAGLTAMFETTGNGFYKKLPERYLDRNYYHYSAFHAAVFAGGALQVPVGKKEGQRLDIYAETGTIDAYVYYYTNNPRHHLDEIFSIALGVTYHFGK